MWTTWGLGMHAKELRRQRLEPKRLATIPQFKQITKNGSYPAPFNRLRNKRVYATGFVDVSSDHQIFMLWRDGDLLFDRVFYAHLYRKVSGGGRYPLFEFHWHPSHKGFHCKVPCRTSQDYTNRHLPQAPELNLKTTRLDPKIGTELHKLVAVFCKRCGIELDPPPLAIGETQEMFV